MASHLHHLALMVDDLERALFLFRDLLGLTLVWRLPQVGGPRLGELLGVPGFQAEMAYLEDAKRQVDLELARPLAPASASPAAEFGAAGSFSLSLMVEHLDDLHDRLIAAGWMPLSTPLSLRSPSGESLRAFCLRPLPGLCLELMEPASQGDRR